MKIFDKKENKTLASDGLIWSVLIVFTLIAWWLGHAPQGFRTEVVTATILILSFIKIRLVIFHFMEIKAAPFVLRVIFDLWCIGVCAMLVFLLVI